MPHILRLAFLFEYFGVLNDEQVTRVMMHSEMLDKFFTANDWIELAVQYDFACDEMELLDAGVLTIGFGVPDALGEDKYNKKILYELVASTQTFDKFIVDGSLESWLEKAKDQARKAGRSCYWLSEWCTLLIDEVIVPKKKLLQSALKVNSLDETQETAL